MIEDDPVISMFIVHQLNDDVIEEIRIYDEFFSVFEDLADFKPDLIIANLHALDGWMDSFDFQLLIKHSRFLLIMTGLTNPALYPIGLNLSSHGFLHKPFNSVQFDKAIS